MATISNSATTASNAVITTSGSQISKQNETLYHQSNLIGTWTGKFTGTNQAVTFKVLKITGSVAEIEYDHNGKAEKGQAQVSQNLITYGDITIGTKNGTNGAIEFVAGNVKKTGTLTKQADKSTPADPTKLVGSWSGLTSSGNAASVTVKSISGDKAQITVIVNGVKNSGTGTYDAKRHLIAFGKTQITSDNGKDGDVIFTSLGKTYSVPVKIASKTASSTSTVSTFA